MMSLKLALAVCLITVVLSQEKRHLNADEDDEVVAKLEINIEKLFPAGFAKMLRAEGYGNVAEAILHSSDFHLHKVAEEAAHAEVTLLSETVVEETQPASTTEKTTLPTSTTTEKVTTAAPVPEETTKLASTTQKPTVAATTQSEVTSSAAPETTTTEAATTTQQMTTTQKPETTTSQILASETAATEAATKAPKKEEELDDLVRELIEGLSHQ